MDLRTLERMTVVKLREEALQIPELSGVRGMNKEGLIRAIAGALNIDLGERRKGGAGKGETKKLISELKLKIADAIAGKDRAGLKVLRRQVKHLKAQTRRLAKMKTAEKAGHTDTAPPPASA